MSRRNACAAVWSSVIGLALPVSTAMASPQGLLESGADEAQQRHPERVLTITADPLRRPADLLGSASNVVSGMRAQTQGSSGLGQAMGQQVGIHASSFGAGASRPVIRGQAGARVQVVQDGASLMDASQLSPDHAIATDPELVRRLEVLRGPATLLYGGGAVGGVVNVVDRRMDDVLPEHGRAVQLGVRADSNGPGHLLSGGISQALNDTLVLRLEGLSNMARAYQSPWQDRDQSIDGSHNRQQTGTLGLSWVTNQGYAGLAYTRQQRRYGLPGHDHSHESCEVQSQQLHCEEPAGGHDHDHDADHDHVGLETPPVLDLRNNRWDLRMEHSQPWAGVQRLSVRGQYTDYQHEELEAGQLGTRFENRGHELRVELALQPWRGWQTVIGTQLGQGRLGTFGEEAMLPVTDSRNRSVFLLTHRQLTPRWHVEGGMRADWQTVRPHADQPDFAGHGMSASLGSGWQLTPDQQLTLTLTRSQRLPSAQELYAQGLHLASNTHELGNPHLRAETIQGAELSLRRARGEWRYAASLYGQRAQDYIDAQTLDQHEGLRLIRYAQQDARFWGGELELSHPLNALGRWTLFADVVRGRLQGKDDDLPRLPADRLGLRLDQRVGQWTGELEWLHVFTHRRIAAFEQVTPSYDLLNATVRHQGVWTGTAGDSREYSVYLTGKNLLNQTIHQHTSFLAGRVPEPGRAWSVGLNVSF